MRRALLFLSALTLVVTAPSPLAQAQRAGGEANFAQLDGRRLPLRVLYVGELTTKRGKAFAAFFKRHCRSTQVADLASFDPKTAKDIDVAVLDHPQKFARPSKQKMPLGADRDAWQTPTVFLGRAMPRLGAPWGLKGQPG